MSTDADGQTREKNKQLVLMEMYGVAQGIKKAAAHVMTEAMTMFRLGKDAEAKYARELSEKLGEIAEQAIDEYQVQKQKWGGVHP